MSGLIWVRGCPKLLAVARAFLVVVVAAAAFVTWRVGRVGAGKAAMRTCCSASRMCGRQTEDGRGFPGCSQTCMERERVTRSKMGERKGETRRRTRRGEAGSIYYIWTLSWDGGMRMGGSVPESSPCAPRQQPPLFAHGAPVGERVRVVVWPVNARGGLFRALYGAHTHTQHTYRLFSSLLFFFLSL